MRSVTPLTLFDERIEVDHPPSSLCAPPIRKAVPGHSPLPTRTSSAAKAAKPYRFASQTATNPETPHQWRTACRRYERLASEKSTSPRPLKERYASINLFAWSLAYLRRIQMTPAKSLDRNSQRQMDLSLGGCSIPFRKSADCIAKKVMPQRKKV